jgi:NAD+ synthase
METSGHQVTQLSLDTGTVRKLLVEFVRDHIRNAGFGKAIVGVSGGVDSAVAVTLAAEALGAENVLGVIMPYKTSNPASASDAKILLDRLAVRYETVDISTMVDAYLATAADADNVRKGNVMARQRMIVLYDLSAREKALVVGTSNKTESLLGYGTQFGDMACAINPLGDLYKTQVWQLAEALGVPKAIIDKKPSADLWQGQTDEAELGFSYNEVDRLLYFLVDERRTDEELVAGGFAMDFVEKVKRLIQRTQFKRRPPVIAKISHRTVNVDFRYPRDWGI